MVRNQAETAEDAESTCEHQRIQKYSIFRSNFGRRNCMWYEMMQKPQKMPKARTNNNAYSSTRFSGLIFEDEMVCIPRTARFVVRNQAEIAEDAESTSDHQRIQQYAIFRFNL